MKTKAPLLRPVSGALLFCLSPLALAQQNLPGAVPNTTSPMSSASSSQSTFSEQNTDDQASTFQRTWTIKPRVTLTETLTDNVSINRSAQGKQSDLITELAPGIRIESRTARLKSYFDYALRGQFYTQTDYSRTQNSLNTFGTLEAVDNWLYLDFSGIIAQQAISAFGTQSSGSGAINNNSTETASYRLSPNIRGQLGGMVDYSLRYNRSTTRSDVANLSNVDLSQWIGQLRGSTPFQNLRWTIDGNQQTTEYSSGRKTEADTLRAIGTYTVLPQFRVSLSAGRESNNYASLEQESHNTHGYGFDWTPTERTRFSAFKENRFFGDGHNISFSHRFPRSSIRFTDTRDVSVLPNQFSSVGTGTVYDQWFQLLENTEPFASMPPDAKEIAVAKAVELVLAKLQLNPNQQTTSNFLTSRATVQRRQQLALVLTGVRNTITFLINRNENQSILAAAALNDDFAQNNVIQQRGFSLNVSHQLSELSSLSFLASRQESTGSGATTVKATMTMLQVRLSTKLGVKTTGSLSARRSEFDNATNPYTENALVGTLSYIY
ncbi:TIGR03016 family PEP-CTERM system-associated outer membrane protein [Dechloromonas sp. A34]|uniref:TIGR03016 family PEP-CTERM system-associated outer membrane protein n=1 Tax=Dechloromonas sp. A34 TaxID=447588 RepID=UPI0022487B47|nr:TIGR03016 family PEP-CTERM system-associated outer membrane protein [Dechloromonas sp. A34]